MVPPGHKLPRSLLEFDKIIALLTELASSPMAKEQFAQIAFHTEKSTIEPLLSEVSEFRGILDSDDSFPLQHVWDVRKDFEIASIAGNLLPVESLIKISQNLATSWRVRSYLHGRKSKYPHLWSLAGKIESYKQVEKEIADKIDFQNNEVKDSASPTLNRLRKEINRMEQNSRKVIDKLFKAYAQKNYLQDEIVTLKDGRLAFPIKSQYKTSVKGLVHDQSATGATLFIEPLEVIELNNEITRLKVEEHREIERILRELTGHIRQDLSGIARNVDALAQLDFIHAKALFSKKLNCTQPALNGHSYINISNGRHPLLMLHKENAEQVVPLNLKLGNPENSLVITGPNAGGKTVALKTVGLFALMVQSGIPIPADPDSSMPVFDRLFVDIGDFQSIEQDLSTFTSHMQKMHEILKNADNRSLILVDEIGVGTDPDEGSALAIAFLEEITKRGCITIVTTHHGALKSFAYETPGVANGSMEFNIETLQPAYRFRTGIPGSSYAIEIANRLGVSSKILKRSRELLGSEKNSLERLILDLEKKVQQSQEFAEKLNLEKTRLEGLSNLYRERYEAIKINEKNLKEEALQKSQQILAGANAALERAIRNIREKQAGRSAIAEAKQLIKTEKEKVAREIKEIESATTEDHKIEELRFEIGELVFWEKQNATGKIVTSPDSSGTVQVQIKQLKFRVPTAELQAARVKPTQKISKSSVKIQTSDKSETLPEIDLRGHRLEDAILEVDKFLDDALLAGWSQVRIIHGKGTGALRRGISEFLNKHQRVKSKKMGAWNEGDMGVTIVELD